MKDKEILKLSDMKYFIVSDEKSHDNLLSLNHPNVIKGIVCVLCVRGQGIIKINLKTYTIKQNSVITLFSESIFELTEKSNDLQIEFVYFSFEYIQDICLSNNVGVVNKIARYPCIEVSDKAFTTLLEYHSFIVKQCRRSHPYRDGVSKHLLMAFILEISSIYEERQIVREKLTSRKEEIMHGFVRLLVNNITKERTVSFYAEQLCLSPKYLSPLVKEISGKHVREWINEISIKVMKSRLKTTSLTVQQIAEQLNFSTPSAFGRYFKKYTGVTPEQYRKS